MVRFTLNGSPVLVEDVDPHVTLLSWLRARGLCGSKEGCAEGECGACAVALLQSDEQGVARYDPVNSCLLPLPSLHGRSVLTVEGVSSPDGALHPVQTALVERGGSQCGYCTPGFVVSLYCEYYRPDRTDYDPESISGNLCRCTGYRPIADAARALARPSGSDPRLPMLQPAPPPLVAMEHVHEGGSGPRSYARPSSLASLFVCWSAAPDATLIAGGTDLMVYANQRATRWSSLIALEAVPELRRFELAPHELTLGAGLSLAEIERRLKRDHVSLLPLLEHLLPLFSSRLIRNRATLGGSLGTASPIGDAAPVLLALDAELTLCSQSGERRLPLHAFFAGYRATALATQELILSVHIPLPAPVHQRFYKVSKRVLDDISTVAAAFTLALDQRGHVSQLRMAYGGVAATPLRARAVEDLAQHKPWNEATLHELLTALASFGTPQSDLRGQAAYRRAMIGRLLEKFFDETKQEADAP